MTSSANFILTAITRCAATVRAADMAGVDRIGVDIERLGKRDRQPFAGARISDHEIEDLATVVDNARQAAPFIRINRIHDGSRAEIDRAVAAGARVIMLPYFESAHAVEKFVEIVAGRASPVLLVETPLAVERIGEIVRVGGVEEIMVGLNDLHRALGLSSHFEVVVSGMMERVAEAVHLAGIRFGFGGLARFDDHTLPVPPDLVYAQYPRLNATSAWLARCFYQGLDSPRSMSRAVAALRARLEFWTSRSPSDWRDARRELEQTITRRLKV